MKNYVIGELIPTLVSGRSVKLMVANSCRTLLKESLAISWLPACSISIEQESIPCSELCMMKLSLNLEKVKEALQKSND